MCNVHPLFRQALAPYAPQPIPLRPFVVTIRTGAKPEELNVLAFTTCDAICNAIDIFFDGDEPMPADGLEIEAHPLNLLPSAA